MGGLLSTPGPSAAKDDLGRAETATPMMVKRCWRFGVVPNMMCKGVVTNYTNTL
jgi:hypothetical protein